MKGLSKYLVGLAAVASIVSSARAAEPTHEELLQKVEQLEARLNQLEEKPVVTPQQVDATVERVLQDAECRSKFLAVDGGFTAGYDRGFFIKSDDGKYVLRPGLLFQYRMITNLRTDGDDDIQHGFENRRVRPRVDGNFLTPDLTYSVVLDTERSGGDVLLLDAWVQYRFLPQWALKAGQFRESWYHEGDVSDSNQLTVERSLVDSFLGGGRVERVQGVSVIYGGGKDDPIRAEFTYHDGALSKNSDFRDAQPGADPGDPPRFISNFGFGGRVEYKVNGDWANYRDFTAKGNKENLLVIGAGIDWSEVGDTDTYRYTGDAQWENTTGWSVYGALIAVCTNFQSTDSNRFDWGGLIQAGYLFQPAWEVFGRYDVVILDDDFVTGENTFNEFTVGVNYFLGDNGSAVHRAKITVDFIYLPQGAPSNQTGTGVLSNPGEDEFVLRGQFQLVL